MNRGFWRLQASLQVGLSPRLWLCIFPNSWRQGCKNSAHAARALETSFRSLQLSRNVGKDAFEHAEHDNTFFQNNASGFYFTIVFNIMSTEEVLACCRPHAPFFCPSSLGFTGDVRRTLTQINSLAVSILSFQLLQMHSLKFKFAPCYLGQLFCPSPIYRRWLLSLSLGSLFVCPK